MLNIGVGSAKESQHEGVDYAHKSKVMNQLVEEGKWMAEEEKKEIESC